MDILIKDILAALPNETDIRSVYIKDGVIVSLDGAPEGVKPDRTIHGAGKMLIPGLVNAHTHVSMTLFRNCADDLLFNDWLFGRVMPLEDKLTGEDCYWGMMLGIMEMLRTGTTAFIDMYYFMDDLVRAAVDSGMRCVLSRGLQGGADDTAAGESRLREALDAIERYKDYKRVSFMLAPHAPYTCDEGYQREVAAQARLLGVPVNTHIAESFTEIDTIRERYNCTPVELLDKTGLLTDTTVAAHCVHLTDGDIGILAKRGVTVVTNPVSNLKLANGVAPVPKLIAAGVKTALGTDSAASNNSLNMFRDLSMLSLIHKGVNHDAVAIPAREGLAIATRGGARAMGMSDFGEIAAGQKADLAILSLDHPNMQPVNDPVAALVYSATGHEVETVMVDGQILYENREFTCIDADRVIFEINKICERIGTKA